MIKYCRTREDIKSFVKEYFHTQDFNINNIGGRIFNLYSQSMHRTIGVTMRPLNDCQGYIVEIY